MWPAFFFLGKNDYREQPEKEKDVGKDGQRTHRHFASRDLILAGIEELCALESRRTPNWLEGMSRSRKRSEDILKYSEDKAIWIRFENVSFRNIVFAMCEMFQP